MPFRKNTNFSTADGLFEKPKPGEKFDCVIATDCASFERLGKAGECVERPENFHQH